MRRFICIFLMMLIPLHSFAMQGGWLSAGSAFDIAHEIDHLIGASHHHDDDHGAVHYDESHESAQHFAEHSASHHCVALPTIVIPPLAASSPEVRAGEPSHYFPDPFPERLQRPPSVLG